MALQQVKCTYCDSHRNWRIAFYVKKRWFCNVACYRKWLQFCQKE